MEFPCGAVLIDAGAQDEEKVDELVRFLNDFFARRQDLNRTLKSIIITHNHIDHTRALRKVVEMEGLTVERYIDHGMLEGTGTGNPNWVRDEVEEGHRQIKIREIKDSAVAKVADQGGLTDDDIDPVQCNDCDPKIHLLFGRITQQPDDWTSDEFENKNNHSLVTRVDFGQSSFLFTGDLEDTAIERLVDRYRNSATLDVDVYEVGHHGSHNGTTDELLDAMTPKIAVISVGHWDDGKLKKATKKRKAKPFTTHAYGHPRRSTIQLLAMAIPEERDAATKQKVADGVADFRFMIIRKKIYATAWDGTIEVQADLQGSYSVGLSPN